jgi:hypothetical protein
MEWRYSVSTRPKQFLNVKVIWKISRLDFVGSIRYLPHCLSSKGPNYQRGELHISAGAIEGHFELKAPRKFHKCCLVLTRQCPGSPGICNPQETGLPGLPES